MMDGFKCILLPIDFSDHSDQAAAHAAWFAAQSQGKVHVVHVVSNPADNVYAPEEAPYWVMVENAERKARELMEVKARQYFPAGTRWEIHVDVGDPYGSIVKTASHVGADLIVMSTHGRTGIVHLVMGSVAEKVVRHSTCPVFVVPRSS